MNAVLKISRSKPILDCLDFIWNWIAEKFFERSVKASSNNLILTDYAKKMLCDNKNLGNNMVCNPYSANHGRVVSASKIYEVELNHKKCNCMLFSDYQFPCKHAFDLIAALRKDPTPLISPCYFRESCKNIYSDAFGVIDISRLESLDIQPPELRILRGRPTKSRIRSRGEIV